MHQSDNKSVSSPSEEERVEVQIKGDIYYYMQPKDASVEREKSSGLFKHGYRLRNTTTNLEAPWIYLKYKELEFNSTLMNALNQYGVELGGMEKGYFEQLRPAITVRNFFDYDETQIPAALTNMIMTRVLMLAQFHHYLKVLNKNEELLSLVSVIGEELVTHHGGFIMPFHEGVSLKARVFEEKGITEPRRNRFLALGLRKLLSIHQKGVVHNDAHLGNMIFDSEDRLHLIDLDDLKRRDDSVKVNVLLSHLNTNAKIDLHEYYKGVAEKLHRVGAISGREFYALPYEECVLTVIDNIFDMKLGMMVGAIKNAIQQYKNSSDKVGLWKSRFFAEAKKPAAILSLESCLRGLATHVLNLMCANNAEQALVKYGMYEFLHEVLASEAIAPPEKSSLFQLLSNSRPHTIRRLTPVEKTFNLLGGLLTQAEKQRFLEVHRGAFTIEFSNESSLASRGGAFLVVGLMVFLLRQMTLPGTDALIETLDEKNIASDDASSVSAAGVMLVLACLFFAVYGTHKADVTGQASEEENISTRASPSARR